MNWDQLNSGILTFLAIALIYKLYLTRLIAIYTALVFFSAYQAFTSLVTLSLMSVSGLDAYYSEIYCVLMGLGWVVTFLVVLNVLQRMLHTLPGILWLSKTVLKVIFAGAVVIGCLSLLIEMSSSHIALITRIVSAVTALERASSTIALFTFLGVLTFLFWFKVQMTKNLVILTVGFLLYFALHEVDFLSQVFSPTKDWSLLTHFDAGLTIGCYLLWLMLLNAKGEETPIRIGSHWDRLQQDRIIRDLESINRSLSRQTHRPA